MLGTLMTCSARAISARDFAASLQGLLLPTQRHKTLTGLVNTVPLVGAKPPRAQKLQWFLSESTWDERQVQAQRLSLLRQDPATAPTADVVLAIDETGVSLDGHHTAHVGRQYLAKASARSIMAWSR